MCSSRKRRAASSRRNRLSRRSALSACRWAKYQDQKEPAFAERWSSDMVLRLSVTSLCRLYDCTALIRPAHARCSEAIADRDSSRRHALLRAFVEHFLEQPAVLVLHGLVGAGLDAGDGADGDVVGSEVDQPLDDGVAEDFLARLAQAATGLRHRLENLVQVALRGQLQVHLGVDVALRIVDDALDLAVGDDVEAA